MLKRVLSLVQAHGWVDPGRCRERAVFMTTGPCLWMLLFDQGRRHTHLKFSDSSCLCREAQLQQGAFEAYPEWVPRPLGHLHEPGLDLVCSQAVDYIPPARGRLLAPRAPMGRELLRYFAAGPNASLPAPLRGPGRAELLADMFAYFRDRSAGAARLLSGMADDPARLAKCPSRLQHGDFVLNNLGDGAGRLHIFDWEEFGAVDLAGLDLFTLLLSLDQVQAWRAREARPEVADFVGQACDAMDLDVQTFGALLPLYGLVFRYLKRNFGASIRQRVDDAVDKLLERVSE